MPYLERDFYKNINAGYGFLLLLGVAVINYSYFRHRFDAHEDVKINTLMDDLGVEGYGYYFTLLEIYGAHYAQNPEETKVKIHTRVIANTWRKRVDSVHLVLTKLQLSGLLVYTKSDSTCIIDIPNFSNYYGSYKKTSTQMSSNKRKEKKRKEKEIYKETESNTVCSAVEDKPAIKPSPTIKAKKDPAGMDVLEYYNQVNSKRLASTPSNLKHIQARLNEGYPAEDLKTLIDHAAKIWAKDDFWKDYNRPSTLFNQKFGEYLDKATSHKKSATEIFIEHIEEINKLGEANVYDWAKAVTEGKNL
jgi:uncharacterized phage protein (TIGR02220 family)